jgi:L-asparagine transporter-like permease
MTSSKPFKYKLALPLAVFGFMFIIATGTSMLLYENDNIPLIIAIIGLILLIIAMMLRKEEQQNQ